MFTSLRETNFRLFWLGQLASLPGSWMQNVALAWLVLVPLKSPPETLGIVFALQFCPILMFGLVGGVIADRVNKRRFLLMTQFLLLMQATCLGLLQVLGLLSLGKIYVLAFIGGLISAFDNP